MYLENIAKWLIGKHNDMHFFRHFVKTLPVPVVIFDKDLLFVAASDRFFEESTIKKEDVVDNPHWYDLVPDMPERWKKAHQEVLNGAHLKWTNDVFYRANGSVEWWNSEQMPWSLEDGEILGIILYIENVTDAKLLENNLHEAVTSLARSNKELSKYAHICAHDLSEPLRAVSNCLQLIDKEYSNTFNEELNSYLKIIRDNTKYMGDLISSLLQYCDHDKKNIHLEMVDVGEIIEDIKNAIKIIGKYKDAEIHYGKMPLVLADKTLLKGVIQNLISNALKYNKSIPVINIKASDTGLFWQFSFEDNGIGIEKRYLRKVFEESVRLNPGSEYEGLGLGLYQCNKTINEHGGKMWVNSGDGEGSTFYFILPKQECTVDHKHDCCDH